MLNNDGQYQHNNRIPGAMYMLVSLALPSGEPIRLDEATSGMDSENEASIVSTLQSL